MNLASIPSPSQGVWHLGPVPIRAYALCIIAGIVVAIRLGEKRWVARGGRAGDVTEVAGWMVPMGILGGRIYHVITSPQAYFGAGGDPIKALYVWQGGLGIWGGITFGVLAGAFVVRRAGASVTLMMECVAPALLVAQGIGRWGNYWNQELYGKPTSLPWGLEIDPDHRPDRYPLATTFHPIFLYEFITDLAGAGLLILVGRRFRIKPPGLFALYVAYYTFWRLFEELLRVDPSHHFLGERINFWVALVVFMAAVASFLWLQFFRPAGPEPTTGPRRSGPTGSMAVPRGRVRSRR